MATGEERRSLGLALAALNDYCAGCAGCGEPEDGRCQVQTAWELIADVLDRCDGDGAGV